jgi:hypothetical protein
MPVQTTLLDAQLRERGIARVESPYSAAQIDTINAVLNEHFAPLAAAPRSYAGVDALEALGLFSVLFSQPVRGLIRTLLPDAVLYHCHVYETQARQNQPHIAAEQLAGWHRDDDSYYDPAEPTHLSIFVYLSNVATDSGGFELRPRCPTRLLRAGEDAIRVMGAPGTTFVWQRYFYHRASPNRSPVRRRVFKLSIQNNRFRSMHLERPDFRRVANRLSGQDEFLEFLFGKYQHRPSAAHLLPAVPGSAPPRLLPLGVNSRVDVTNGEVVRCELKSRYIRLRRRVLRETAVAAYD